MAWLNADCVTPISAAARVRASFLEMVTHVGVSTLSLILLVIGVAGFIGTVLIGSVP